MDLKSGIVCSLPVLLLIFTAYSEAFPFRKDNEELVSALARLDRALGEMISKTDGSIPYKRNEVDHLQERYEGDVPYKRTDTDIPYKRTSEKDVTYRDDVDEDVPYKRQELPDEDVPYKRQELPDEDVPYKRQPRNESLDRVLRYLLDMEDRLHERNADKRDHDDQ